MKVFVLDMETCVGCYGCQLACKDEHVGNDWMPYSKPQPMAGHFWMKVNEITHGQVPKVKLEYIPVACMHCDDAPCIAAGNGAVYKRDDGLVIIDPEKAKGNKALLDSCPYHAIYWNEELEIPQKCTGCAHLVDEGKTPHCVDVCVLEALRFGDEEDFADEIAVADTLHPEYGTKPRFYYLNRPKLFISGDVWDKAADEIIKGAAVTLEGVDGKIATTETDHFGDFWFRKLDAGDYRVTVVAEGYATQTRDVHLDKSLNIGDFPMMKAQSSEVAK